MYDVCWRGAAPLMTTSESPVPLPAGQGTVSYRGATEDELRGASGPKRTLSLGGQGRLFSHHGVFELDEGVIVLGGWRRLTTSQVTSVELTFTAAYTRWQAAGARGNYPSFGAFGSLGKPLVLKVVDEAPLYLLLGYRWWSGANQNRRWHSVLTAWLDNRGTGGGRSST